MWNPYVKYSGIFLALLQDCYSQYKENKEGWEVEFIVEGGLFFGRSNLIYGAAVFLEPRQLTVVKDEKLNI